MSRTLFSDATNVIHSNTPAASVDHHNAGVTKPGQENVGSGLELVGEAEVYVVNGDRDARVVQADVIHNRGEQAASKGVLLVETRSPVENTGEKAQTSGEFAGTEMHGPVESSSEADESEAALVVETGALLQNTGDNAQTTGEIVKTEVLPPVESAKAEDVDLSDKLDRISTSMAELNLRVFILQEIRCGVVSGHAAVAIDDENLFVELTRSVSLIDADLAEVNSAVSKFMTGPAEGEGHTFLTLVVQDFVASFKGWEAVKEQVKDLEKELADDEKTLGSFKSEARQAELVMEQLESVVAKGKAFLSDIDLFRVKYPEDFPSLATAVTLPALFGTLRTLRESVRNKVEIYIPAGEDSLQVLLALAGERSTINAEMFSQTLELQRRWDALLPAVHQVVGDLEKLSADPTGMAEKPSTSKGTRINTRQVSILNLGEKLKPICPLCSSARKNKTVCIDPIPAFRTIPARGAAKSYQEHTSPTRPKRTVDHRPTPVVVLGMRTNNKVKQSQQSGYPGHGTRVSAGSSPPSKSVSDRNNTAPPRTPPRRSGISSLRPAFSPSSSAWSSSSSSPRSRVSDSSATTPSPTGSISKSTFTRASFGGGIRSSPGLQRMFARDITSAILNTVASKPGRVPSKNPHRLGWTNSLRRTTDDDALYEAMYGPKPLGVRPGGKPPNRGIARPGLGNVHSIPEVGLSMR